MDYKSVAIGVAIALLVVAAIGGIMFGVTQMDDSPINQTEETETPTPEQTVNEDEVPQQVIDSKPGAVALKEAFIGEYEYQNNVSIQKDGNLVLQYSSSAQNGNQLKDEMKQVALLYADVAAEHPEAGALTIHANGVVLTVPDDSAQAHGNGDIDEEAFFETVRWDTVEE